MKKIVFLIVFLILLIILTEQNVSGEEIEGEEERKIAVEKASDALKRNNTRTEPETTTEPEKIEEKDVKKKLGKLKKFLPTEEEFDEIAQRVVWRYVDKQSNINEENNMEIIQALVRDIGRIYDPVVNKYKVATIHIEIIKFENKEKLENYWITEKQSNLQQMYDNSYLTGSPNENINCFFNYTTEGAITVCKTNEFLIQSIIYDKYQEHFNYSEYEYGMKKLELTPNEMTTRVVDKILKKILNKDEIIYEEQLNKILELNEKIKKSYSEHENNIDKQDHLLEEKKKNKLLGVEKDKKYGIQKISCIKDEFNLITISGQFNNDQIQKDKVVMEITFLDHKEKIIFKNTANLLDIKEFETKRFLGNVKINENFSTCTIKINN